MQFFKNPLYNECEKIMSGTKDIAMFYYEMILITPVKNHRPIKLLSIDNIGDYVRNFSDVISVSCVFPSGDYTHEIRPYYEDIEVIILRRPDQLNTKDVEVNFNIYRGIIQQLTPDYRVSGDATMDEQELANLTKFTKVDIDLHEKIIEEVKNISVGTVLYSSTPASAISTLLPKLSSDIKLDNQNVTVSFDMQPPHNTQAQAQIVIPPMKLTDLGDYMQSEGGGVYNHDIAVYLKKGSWYVWSVFDPSEQDYVDKTITFILAPKDRYPGIERTYRTTTRQTLVMVTGDRKHLDHSQVDRQNVGTGIRFTNPGKLLDDFVKMDGDKPTINRSSNTTEVLYDPNPTGKNNVRDIVATNNIYEELSKVAPQRGSYLNLMWENSNPDLIRPDMNVRVMVMEGGTTNYYNGRILGVHTYIQNVGEGVLSNRFGTASNITLFMEEAFGRTDDLEGV